MVVLIRVGTRFQSCSYFENTLLPANLPSLVYAAEAARAPYITPGGPDTAGLSVSPNPAPPGTPVTLGGTVDDTHYDNSNGTEPAHNIAAAEHYVDVPPWEPAPWPTPCPPPTAALTKTEAVTASVDTARWSDGKHILLVRGRDGTGTWGAVTAVFLTFSAGANLPPVASFTYSCDGLTCTTAAFATTASCGIMLSVEVNLHGWNRRFRAHRNRSRLGL